MACFTVEGIHHVLLAARLSAEYGIAVRHGCFCADPYVVRLLGLGESDVAAYRSEVLHGDHRNVPGAVRRAPASAPPERTSTRSSGRSRSWPEVRRPSLLTSRTLRPATTSPRRTWPAGRTRYSKPAPPAREVDHDRPRACPRSASTVERPPWRASTIYDPPDVS